MVADAGGTHLLRHISTFASVCMSPHDAGNNCSCSAHCAPRLTRLSPSPHPGANRTEPDDMDGSLSCSMENLFPVNNEETGPAATRN